MQMFPQSDCLWLLCIATHGAGEYADSIAPFMETLQREQPLLSALSLPLSRSATRAMTLFAKLDEMPNRYFWS